MAVKGSLSDDSLKVSKLLFQDQGCYKGIIWKITSLKIDIDNLQDLFKEICIIFEIELYLSAWSQFLN